MPKNNKNEENVSNETVTANAPVTKIATRRLGTGAIIGISAASLALLAGVFGGGIAFGATTAHRGPAGVSGQMEQADGPMRGQMQGGQMQGGSGQHADNDGLMGGKMGGKMPPKN